MPKRVLLVDPDVDSLGELAEALRARGLQVSNASDAFEAVEQAYKKQPDVVLLAPSVDSEGDLTAAFRAVPDLPQPPLLILTRNPKADLAPNELPRGDVDALVAKLLAFLPRESIPSFDDLRGNLSQTPLPDLLQLLTMNQRSGALTITGAAGAGEVRLSNGEIASVTHGRHEGAKAFIRLLQVRDATFAFVAGAPTAERRINEPTAALVMDGLRLVDEISERRKRLSADHQALSLDVRAISRDENTPTKVSVGMLRTSREGSGPVSLAPPLTTLLRIPRTVDEILDELPTPDRDLLDQLLELDANGQLRRTSLAELNVPLCPREHLPIVRSLVTRLRRRGFSGAPRIVFVASRSRLRSIAYSLRRIIDAVAAPELPFGGLGIARPLGTLRLGEGTDLALVGLASDDAFAPTWPFALGGALVVLRTREGGAMTLAEHCESVEAPLYELDAVQPSFDPGSPAHVAAAIRGALERSAGVTASA